MMFKDILIDLKAKFIEGLKVAGKAFLETLWNYIKEDVILSARKSLKVIESYLNSEDGIIKKKYLVDLIMKKIKLPLPLKPFKFVVKNIIEDKIDEIIKELIEKSNMIVNNKIRIMA